MMINHYDTCFVWWWKDVEMLGGDNIVYHMQYYRIYKSTLIGRLSADVDGGNRCTDILSPGRA